MRQVQLGNIMRYAVTERKRKLTTESYSKVCSRDVATDPLRTYKKKHNHLDIYTFGRCFKFTQFICSRHTFLRNQTLDPGIC